MRCLLLILTLSIVWGCAEDKTTTSVTDDIPPYVIATHPADGDSNVALYAPIACTFSEAVDTATIDESSFIVTWITEFPGVVTYADQTATFSHAAPMRHNVVYQATIKKSVKDRAGNAMTEDYTWSFKTAAGPSVVETNPLDGDTGVALNAIITAAFSDPMNPASLDTSTFKLSDGVTGSVSCGGAAAAFDPDIFLTHNHTYTATITNYVADTAGNTMPNDYSWSFTTTATPLIIETYPADGAVSIPPDTTISVTFSIDMIPETFSPETFYLSDGVTGTVTYENRKAVFIPDDSLTPDHIYTATITTDVCDIYGHTMGADYSWSFATQGKVR